MRIHVSIIGGSYEQYSSISQSFAEDVVLNISSEHGSLDGLQEPSHLLNADFVVYYLDSSSSMIAHGLLGPMSKAICLFEKKSEKSETLAFQGFTVLYGPGKASQLIEEIKTKLSVNLKRDTTKSDSPDVKSEKSLVFSSSDRFIMIDKETLMHAKSAGNYTTLYLSNQKQVTITKQIGKVADRLPDATFFRVHHSHLINRAYILSVLKQKDLMVELRDKTKVPVSRRKKKKFLAWLGLH